MNTEQLTVTWYDPLTGALGGIRSGLRKTIDREGLPYLEGEYHSDKYYVDITTAPHRVEPRPAMPVSQKSSVIHADGNDILVLSGLPEPCAISIGNHDYSVGDGTLEWSTLMPGVYPIRVRAWPYVDFKGEVTAVAGEV